MAQKTYVIERSIKNMAMNWGKKQITNEIKGPIDKRNTKENCRNGGGSRPKERKKVEVRRSAEECCRNSAVKKNQ